MENITTAQLHDLPAILALQKLAYQSEAELLDDFSIPPLHQTLTDTTEDFNNGTILKAVDNNEIIGSVRVHIINDTMFIGKLIVTPSRQNQGIGKALLFAAENLYPSKRFELFTSSKSSKNLLLYTKCGYIEFKREPLNKAAEIIFLEKMN